MKGPNNENLSLVSTVILISALAVPQFAVAQAQPAAEERLEMGFFVTSVGVGDGGDLGGLEGADAHCQSLADSAGVGHRVWRAYLSTRATDSDAAVDARDRIGAGPWVNAKGVVMAANLDDLMYNNANLHYENSLDEKGYKVNSGANGDTPNRHDVLTGTELDGTAPDGDEDLTCGNWTSNTDGKALVGHHDRFRRDTPGSPWNNAHPSRGCSQENLKASGGDGLFYCFAAK